MEFVFRSFKLSSSFDVTYEPIRKAIDNAKHSCLFFVDTISSLGSMDYKHDEWGVDVTIGGSQKGLLLPPGLSFNAISSKAIEAYKKSKLSKSYWDWKPMIDNNKNGFFPYTPATNLLYGLYEALKMLFEEGLENVRELYGAGTSEALTHDSYEARRYVPLSTEDLIILYRKEIEVVTALQNVSVIISDLKVTGMGVEENYPRQYP